MSVAQEFPPRSLAAIRPRIPESGAAQTDVLPGARRERGGEGERCGGGSWHCGSCWRLIAPADRWSICGVVSGKHRRGVLSDGLYFTPHGLSCASASTLEHVGVSPGSSLMRRKKKERKKVWQASSALNERQINVGPGRLSSARRGPINALQATTQPRHLVAAQAQWQQASSQRDHHRDEHKPVARLRSLTHR